MERQLAPDPELSWTEAVPGILNHRARRDRFMERRVDASHIYLRGTPGSSTDERASYCESLGFGMDPEFVPVANLQGPAVPRLQKDGARAWRFPSPAALLASFTLELLNNVLATCSPGSTT